MANIDEHWLEFLRNVNKPNTSSLSIKTVTTRIKKEEEPLIPIAPDKLFELYGNLVLAGFEKEEALAIVVMVIKNASRAS